jgi:uncharacterized protein
VDARLARPDRAEARPGGGGAGVCVRPLLRGARQVGKSTLAQQVAAARDFPTVVTLDDAATRMAAEADPTGFLADLERPVLIDEVQRAPDLLLAIKQDVDRSPRAFGRYLLTGSANVVTTRTIKDALTGRIEAVNLWPLAQSEIEGSRRNFVDQLWSAEPPRISGAPVGRGAFVHRVTAGGYPEARTRGPRRRGAWFTSYLNSILDRDLRDISDAQKLQEVPRLLRYLAAQAANLLRYRSIASRLDLDHKTVKEYVQLLETVFLVQSLPPWRPSIGAREVQAEKGYVADSGLLAHLLGAGDARVATADQITGKILENFVVMEIVKHRDWAATRVRIHHYRQRDEEVDIVLENNAGEVACIEVKAAATVRPSDWRTMGKLRDARGDKFRAGVVIYSGEQTIPLGDRLWAAPVSGLWS